MNAPAAVVNSWARLDSNQRATSYEPAALPLSYRPASHRNLTAGQLGPCRAWAANSYKLETLVSVDRVIGWFRGRFKDRATLMHGRIPQLAVNGGSYVINVLKSGAAGASINDQELIRHPRMRFAARTLTGAF